jgi:hypothetical protein
MRPLFTATECEGLPGRRSLFVRGAPVDVYAWLVRHPRRSATPVRAARARRGRADRALLPLQADIVRWTLPPSSFGARQEVRSIALLRRERERSGVLIVHGDDPIAPFQQESAPGSTTG